MKLSAINQAKFYYVQNKPKDKLSAKNNRINLWDNNHSLTVKNYFIPFFGSCNYSYKPITSKKPNFDVLNCDYSSLKEFPELFAKKINSQLMTIEQKDIDSLIQRLKISTGADEDLIIKVLDGLTQFSNYDSIDFLQSVCEKHNTKVGGVKNSKHTKGLAADLSCSLGAVKMFEAVKKLHTEGKLPDLDYCIRYKTFIHIDSGGKRKTMWEVRA